MRRSAAVRGGSTITAVRSRETNALAFLPPDSRMVTMSQTVEAPPVVMPEACGTAREYAVQKLQASETPMGAAELCEEYGCTKDHMRHVLADAVEDGEIERIALGRYDAEDVYNDSGEENDGDDGEPSEASDAAVSLAVETDEDYQDERTDEHGEDAREAAESGDGEHTSVPTGVPSQGGDGTDSVDPDGVGGVPVGAVVIGAVVLAAVLFFSRSSSTSSSSSARSPQTEQSGQMDRNSGGGLAG